jgi:hypothetical protein
MHEATQRFCCRAGFLLFCLLPTLLVGSWIGARRTTAFARSQQAHWEATLAQALGLAARVGRVEELRPGAYILHNIALIDPDAPADQPPLATAKRVQLGAGAMGLVILATEGEVASRQLPRLWTVLHERLLRGPSVATAPVQLSIASLTLAAPPEAPQQSLTLSGVRLQLAAGSSGARGQLEFRLAGETGEPARLSITRNRARHPVATEWTLHTGAAPLPCFALAPCLPQLERLGDACEYHGVLTVQTQEATSNATAAGEFRQVNLTQLVSEQFPHLLTGLADVVLNDARWEDGQLVTLAGSLRAPGGTISQSLWEAGRESLQLTVAQSLNQPNLPQIRYGELAFGFQLDGNQLRLGGQCVSGTPQTVLTDTAGYPLVLSTPRNVPAVALVQALVDDSDVQVPAVNQVRTLLFQLPLPDATPRTVRAPAHSGVRLQR